MNCCNFIPLPDKTKHIHRLSNIMIKKNYKAALSIILLLNISYCSAQFFPPKNYPQNYFTYPVEATVSLSANFGALRPNHFHMGLDCKTDKVQNKKVLAAADGYIAKVKIESWGFGRAIYINHPNGLTTLYAHLNEFYPKLETYIKVQQYKLKSWAVYIDVPENLFLVTQGMFIANSGNTGGSQGPHLHFEIRDTKTDKTLNPLLFGFAVPDTIAPDVLRLAVYNRNISTYEQAPKIYPLKKVKGIYVTNPALIIANTNKVSFGISAFDRSSGSSNRNGIYQTILYQNELPVTGFEIDNIGYDETRYLNAHIDYKLRSSDGPFVQHLSKLPGYNNSIYNTTYGDGIITLDDDSIYTFKLEVKDANGNTSLVRFEMKKDSTYKEGSKNSSASFFQPHEFHPGFINVFENNTISFYLPKNCLYDSMRFTYKEIIPAQGYPIYQLHKTTVSLHCYFPITIKATSGFPDKMIMHRFANGKDDYKKAMPVTYGKESGWFKASFREFGSFRLMIDTMPPTITPIGFKNGMNCSKQSRIVFVVKDNTEEIKKFTATLDGNWLRFSNDKGSRFIYDFDEMCPAGEHELKIVAEDQVGNINEKIYKFTR